MTVTDNDVTIAGERHNRFDLIVVGAGSAGFSAAIAAAELGASVALTGHGTIGGTCVNVGCVPSKTLLRAAEIAHQARAASRFDGVRASARIEDWAAVVAQKDALVAHLRQTKYTDLLSSYSDIAYVPGRTRLTSEGVGVNGSVLRSDRVVVATGASPAVPDIPGLGEMTYLTSTSALELDDLPASLLVVGGGYIGCELAQLFARAGVKVTLVCRSRLLPGAEPEIGNALAKYFAREGIDVRCGLAYRSFERRDGLVRLNALADGKDVPITAERLLLATGRVPNSDGLGLPDVGVDVEANGAIRVDDRLRTSRAGIYAAGDVTGRHPFVYMAAYGARIAAENALNGDKRRYDASAMPAVVFTDPQVASVGLTEAAARQQGCAVKASVLPLDLVPRALAARDTRGLIKLVADGDTDRLLGAHILAPEGGESIQTAALAIKHAMTVGDLAETIFPYLTTVEGLKLAAQTFSRDIARLSCCAG